MSTICRYRDIYICLCELSCLFRYKQLICGLHGCPQNLLQGRTGQGVIQQEDCKEKVRFTWRPQKGCHSVHYVYPQSEVTIVKVSSCPCCPLPLSWRNLPKRLTFAHPKDLQDAPVSVILNEFDAKPLCYPSGQP